MIDIYKAETKPEVKQIACLATIIWTEHYTPIIGKEQVSYMLTTYQSATAIAEQIIEGTSYYRICYQKKIVGYFSFYPKKESLFLSKFYILKTHRGLGLGKKTLLFIEDCMEELGLQCISLTVNKYNDMAISAYEKMGFINRKAMVQDIGNGYVMDDYLMEKEFSG